VIAQAAARGISTVAALREAAEAQRWLGRR